MNERRNQNPISDVRADDKKVVKEIADSMRRIDTNRAFDGQKLRTIWHQGLYYSDLFTWVDEARVIYSQQFTFGNRAILIDNHGKVRTGWLNQTGEEIRKQLAGKTEIIDLESLINFDTLKIAHTIFEQMQARDRYTRQFFESLAEALHTQTDEWSDMMDLTTIQAETAKQLLFKRKRNRIIIASLVFLVMAATVWLGYQGYELFWEWLLEE